MHIIWNKSLSLLLAAFLGVGNISGFAPAHYEEEPASGDDEIVETGEPEESEISKTEEAGDADDSPEEDAVSPSMVDQIEETYSNALEQAEQHEYSWRWLVSQEEYDELKDINFDSCRILAAIDPSYIYDRTVILSEYNGVYLLQFEDAETTRSAYAYLRQYAEFIDVDSAVTVADEDGEEETPEVEVIADPLSTENNPLSNLASILEEEKEEADAKEEQSELNEDPVPDSDPDKEDKKVIALIDTGSGTRKFVKDEEIITENEHVIKSVSMIGGSEDTVDDNGHGNRMIGYIAEEADDAEIISIKALDYSGKGNVSAVYAAIMYAIENEADIINLSVSAPATAENAVLQEAIKQAVEHNIIVVAAAGNNNKNIKYYTPGNVEEAYTIGAIDEKGKKAEMSNYGELMDYAVKAETTSEAAARFTGILYKSSIEEIDSGLNNGKVFSPIIEKPVEEPDVTPEPEKTDEPEDGSLTTAGGIVSDDRGVTSIDSFDIMLVSGAKPETYQDEPVYIWNANRSTKDHGFVYRVFYSTSGVDSLDIGEFHIRIPKQILRDREGNFAGKIEMALPREDEVDDGDIENELVYREDGDFYDIYNRVPWSAANEGYIEVVYRTNKPTFDYMDMGASDPFYATISAKSLTDTPLTAESRRIPVYINTTAYLTYTNKHFPKLYKVWQPEWGEAPAGASEYWYLSWEIETSVYDEISQPYDFTIEDTLGYIKGWNDENQEVTIAPEAHQFVGYRMAGQYGLSDNHDAENQRIYGKRYDTVITKLDKSVFSLLKRFEVENKVDVELTPIDGIDEPTSAKSSNVFKYERPEFKKPPGHFISWKRADGAFRRYESSSGSTTECIYTGTNTSSTYLGMKGARYTRYDLEEFKDEHVDYFDNFDYATWVLGFAWPWTLEDGADWRDTTKYGIQPVHYELTDETFYLHEDGGASNTRLLTSEDFQIDHLSIGLQGKDAAFDEDSQTFVATNVTWSNDEVVHIYARFDDDPSYVHVADFYPKANTVTVIDTSKVNSTSQITNSTNTRAQRLFFADNCVGYKVETENAHYFTKLDTVPNIRLKNSEYVMGIANDVVSIAIDNKSHSLVNQTIGSETTVLYEAEDTDTDFAREIERSSYIDKNVISSFNNVKKKKYIITWKASMYERYIEGMGEEHYLTQESGTYYDLIPLGLNPSVDSVSVSTQDGYLSKNAYDVELIPNFRDTGRYMLKVHVKEPADYYNVFFDTSIDWNTINDVGRDVYNPIAYETGNLDIKDGFPDNGGEIQESELMTDLNDDPSDQKGKFLYAEENFDIVAITAGNTGLMKQIKEARDENFSYDTVTEPNGFYSYKLRYANTVFTSSRDIILFDTLENYGTEGLVGDGIAPHEPDWKGTLLSIDTTQMKIMGIRPVVYVSETPHLDLDQDENHDISNTSVWTEQTAYLSEHSDLSGVKAIAIDCSHDTEGNAFILEPAKSVMALLYMQAPATAESDGTRIPETFNNIYLQNITIDSFGNETPFYIHHDYTAIRFIVKEDVKAKKVSADDNSIAVPNITFRVYGTSDYGTSVDEFETSDRRGEFTFDDIEMGTYILQEYEATPDWLEDHTEHTLQISETGEVIIDGQNYTDEQFIFEDKPRIHANINLLKKEINADGAPVFAEDAWDPERLVKYAVSIYGIGQDHDENGDQMGLTFGPATGECYLDSFKTHVPDGKTALGNDHHCVHNDSWEEICYWNFIDPYVYEQCIAEGCTKSVPLDLPSSIKRQDTLYPTYTGDGPSGLMYELKDRAKWYDYGSGTSNWGLSNLRAVLNGVDDDSSDGITTGNMWARSVGITENSSLYAAFPEVLKNAIGNRATKYDSVYNARVPENVRTTYDKLWLIAPNEIVNPYPDSYYASIYDHPLEVDFVYQRFEADKYKAKVGNNAVYNPNWVIHYAYNVTNPTAMGSNTEISAYLRTVTEDNNRFNVIYMQSWMPSSGEGVSLYTSGGDNNYALAPCFSLTRDGASFASSDNAPAWATSVAGYQATNSFPALNGLINDTTFELKGTSDYGNEVDEVVTTNNRGQLSFKNIEKGTYKLREITANPNYVKDDTEWTVTIDENGLVTTDAPVELGKLTIENNPKYWDFPLRKVDAEDNNIWLQGAVINLKGLSDSGNPYDVTVTSGANGELLFEEVESGTYVLTELSAPQGVDAQGHTSTGGTRNYLTDPVGHLVTISETGVVSIKDFSRGSTGEYFMPNDRAMDGRIKIIKHWIYVDGDELPSPQLTLTSTEPGTEPTYTVTFDANGGHFDTNLSTNVVYMTSQGPLNVVKEGEVKTPEPGEEGLVFDGWYKDKSFTQSYNPISELTENITVYAKWKDTRIRYAVSVYGIGQDYDQNGNQMGLTFGPATGADYVNSFKRHDATGTTAGGHDHRCIHDDTWNEIIYWNGVDPDVYEQCVGECCTKSVPLDIPTEIKNTSTLYVRYTGDGPSVLYYELNQYAERWNAWGSSYGGTGSNGYGNAGGWGASNARAVLNGVDDAYEPTSQGTFARARNLTSENCLLAAFPENLQNAIGYKAVKYDSVYNARTTENLKTTYDKLWLLSPFEMGDSATITIDRFVHPLEALPTGVYQRFTENELLSESAQSFFTCYYASNLTSSGTSSQNGSVYCYWTTRSLSADSSQNVILFGDNGSMMTGGSAINGVGISPCFSLSR